MIKNTDNKNFKSINIPINEESEDVTKYGEFVSSYFAWISLDHQRERVEKMQNITDIKNKE